MSLLDQILKDMWIDPELLEELSKEQKEVLFHKMREEQIRRWSSRQLTLVSELSAKPKTPARLQFAQKALIWEDGDNDKRAVEAAARLAAIEKQREVEEMAEDERQAKLLAELQVQEEVKRATMEAARRAEELRQREEAEKKRLIEQAEADRLAAIEREQYLSLKEARLEAEREAAARAQREQEAQRLADERAREEAKLEEERKRAEEHARAQAEAKQQEIYLSMREIREQARRARDEEEKRMEELFAEQQRQAKQAMAEKKAAVAKAKQDAAALDKTGSLLQKLKLKAEAPASGPAPPLPPKSASMRASASASGNPNARSSRPENDSAVIQWFRTSEVPRQVGRDLSGRWEPWFHGMISRGEAEQMLRNKPLGAFLVRVSTRIWGYTLSFVDSDRMKHFLVDASDGMYKVFGAQTSRAHNDLMTLISFHMSVPVSKTGTKLTVPVGNPGGNVSIRPLVM
eukprot:m.33778 g.33778  ORF g.33778 m.33778 type:complete len:460 (+) comp9671_c0_seq2:410-1789(+)